MEVVELHLLGDRLSVVHLWLAHDGVHVVFTPGSTNRTRGDSQTGAERSGVKNGGIETDIPSKPVISQGLGYSADGLFQYLTFTCRFYSLNRLCFPLRCFLVLIFMCEDPVSACARTFIYLYGSSGVAMHNAK